MTKKYICTLPSEIKQCPFRSNDSKCNMDKDGCGFRKIEQEQEQDKTPSQYVRKERWYEKYYKRS